LNRRIVVAVVAVALAALLILNLYFYLYMRVQSENVVNNMMARALASYSGQIDTAEYFLNQYLDTKNRSLLENEASWCAYSAELAADVCRQGSNEEMYSQLWSAAVAVQGFGSDYVGEGGTVNDTKLTTAISALDHVWRFFSGFELLKDENPVEYLTKVVGANATATVIYYCQIAEDNLPRL
jgi:hypothetical protein